MEAFDKELENRWQQLCGIMAHMIYLSIQREKQAELEDATKLDDQL